MADNRGIYRGGRLVGVEDPNRGVSRLPTQSETVFNRPTSNNVLQQPSQPQQPQRTVSGGSSRRNPITQQPEYQLSSGAVVPATQQTRSDIVAQRPEVETIARSTKQQIDSRPKPSPFDSNVSGKPTISTGVLLVNPSERFSGGALQTPTYKLSATDVQGAILEGSLVGQTDVGQGIRPSTPVISRGQFEYQQSQLGKTKEVYGTIELFKTDPESFVKSGKATGISTASGYEYELNDKAFSNIFSDKNNLGYLKSARSQYETLPSSTKTESAVAGFVYAGGKMVSPLAEFSPSKTFATSFGVQTLTPERQQYVSTIYTDSKLFENIKSVRPVESIYGSRNIPVVTKLTGIEAPKNIKDSFKYGLEIGKRPEQVFAIASTTFAGSGAIKGVNSAKALYTAERLAGASRMEALNVVGGEAIYSISPIRYGFGKATPTEVFSGQRIFITGESRLKPFSTTQVNKGGTVTFTKTGEVGGYPTFSGKGSRISYTPKEISYVSVRPKLSGIEIVPNKISASSGSIVNLRQNMFTLRPTENENVFKVTGKGQREVITFGNRPVQTGRYTLGTRGFVNREIQDFSTFGRARKLDGGIDISTSKSFFRPVERTTYLTGYKSMGKDVLPTGSQQGKAFGRGISGRPSTAKGLDFGKELGRVEQRGNTIIFGKSFGKSMSGGTKQVGSFNTITNIPQTGIKIDYLGGNQQQRLPRGFSVKNVYTKGEFNFLNINKQQQVNINPSIRTTLSSPKSNFRPSSIQISRQTPINMNVGTLRSGLVTSNVLKVGSLSFKGQTTSLMPLMPSISTSTKYSSGLGITPITNQIPPQSTPTISTQNLFTPKLTTPSFFTPTTPFRFTQPPINPPPIIGLPSAILPDFTPAGRRAGKRKYKRTPSLISSQLGITSTREVMGETTGLVARPILKRRSRR